MYIANCSVTSGMSDLESLNVKLSETDILSVLMYVVDWIITCMLDGASLFFSVLYYVFAN